MKRISRKRVEDICKLFGYSLIKHQMLGNRQNYWYLYSVVDKDHNRIINQTTLSNVYDALCEECAKRLEV